MKKITTNCLFVSTLVLGCSKTSFDEDVDLESLQEKLEYYTVLDAFNRDTQIEIVSEPVSVEYGGIDVNKNEIKNIYTWKLVGQLLKFNEYHSVEEGTLIKVNNEWIWKSLVHKGFTKTGNSIGSTTDLKLVAYKTNIGKFHANCEITAQFNASASIKGFPITRDEPINKQSPIWDNSAKINVLYYV